MPKIEIKSTINSAQYKRGIKEMQSQNSKFGKSTSGIQGMIKGAFAVGAVVAFIGTMAKAALSLINFGSKLTDMAVQSDVNVETFQKLGRAVRDAGGDQNALVNSLVKVKAAQGDVLGGNTEYLKSFNLLGISTQDLIDLNTEELFMKIARGVTESGNAALQYNAALEIIGKRGGGRLIEAINAIGGEVDGLGDGLKVLSNRNAQVLDIMADRWELFKNNLQTTGAKALAMMSGGSVENELNKRLNSQRRQADQARRGREEQAKQIEQEKEAVRLAKEREDLEKNIVAKRKEQERINKQLKDIETRIKVEIDTDKFRQIGGIAGNMVSQQLLLARRQLTIEQEQSRLLKGIEENTREGGGLA